MLLLNHLLKIKIYQIVVRVSRSLKANEQYAKAIFNNYLADFFSIKVIFCKPIKEIVFS